MAIPVKSQLARYRQAARNRLARSRAAVDLTFEVVAARFRQADVSLFHEFRPPPDGGGHQFLRALWGELERRGLRVENNTISGTTRACLYNSFNFDFDRLRRFRRAGCRMVHRVDGPIGAYRGWDDGSDRRIWQINQDLADATIFQSSYSLYKHVELGYVLKSPHVIMNAADPHVFHPHGRVALDRRRKIRLISASWSDNPNKGAAVYQWLDAHLDWDRFEYTFVGRSQIPFKRIRMLAPVPSEELAGLLRRHDVYITASRNDPCSNALIEALSCGLPALYLGSGGHPEIVGEAGFGFADEQEIPGLLDRLVDEYEERRTRIALPTLSEVADRYLAVLGIQQHEVMP
ncbi:MAG: glycosyltransferase family 4 protein [Chloroflexi bacterium]|nr:glycosyltransferase family 4 protein [Chloroflexota bacterium]